MELTFEIIKLIGWVVVFLFVLISGRKIPRMTYYAMFLSSILMIYSSVEDVLLPNSMLTDSIALAPAQFVIIATYIIGIIRYRKHYDRSVSDYLEIEKFLDKIENND